MMNDMTCGYCGDDHEWDEDAIGGAVAMQDTVKRYIEAEFGVEVTELAIRRIKNTDEYKVDGIAFRNGERLSVMGTCNAHNYSGVRVYGSDDDPFSDL